VALESPLLERERETEALRQVLDEVVRTRSGRVVVVDGEAGIGKTRLVRYLRGLALDHGVPVFSARASTLDQSFGFGVARQLLERASGGARDVLAVPTGADEGGDPGSPGELAALHRLYWLTVDACPEPTVLVVDDVQWCDPESLRYLDHLRLRLDDLPVLLVVVARSGEPAPAPVASLVAALLDDAEAVHVRPARLGSAAVKAFLEAVLDGPVENDFAGACETVTAGNPFLLTVLAASIAREGLAPTGPSVPRVSTLGSEAVQRQIGRRLDRMDPRVRRTAEAAAALGPDTALALVAGAAGVDVLTAAEHQAELRRWGLLDVADAAGTRVAFQHPAVADAVLALMTPRGRQQLRRRCADALETAAAEPERVAAQLLDVAAGVDPEARRRLERAAEAALRRGAPESALTYLNRALEEETSESQRVDLLGRAGALALQTDLDVATRLLERATHSASGERDPELWAQLAYAYGYLRHPDEAVAAMGQALRLLGTEDEDRRRRWEASLLVGAAVVPGRRDLAQTVTRLRAVAPAGGVGGRMLDAALALHEAATGDPAGRTRAHRALADGLLVEQANGEGPLVCGWLVLAAADDSLGLDSLDEAVRRANEHGSLRALAAAVTFRALARLRAGQVADAAEDGRAALEYASGDRVDLDPRFAGGYLAAALLDAGDLEDAERVLESVRAFDAVATGPRYYAREIAARLRRRQNRPDEALDLALDAGRIWAEFGFDNPGFGAWRSEAALAAYALGERDRAVALARDEVDLAEHWGAPRARAVALRALGQVTGGAAGLDLLASAVDVVTDSLARVERATCLLAFGAALRRAGRRTDAYEQLAQALDLAEVCGAGSLTGAAALELRAAGFRPRRHRLAGPEALTISERRVVDLAVDGASNRTIAQALFVTPKTVELHLTNAYRKLGVRGRGELGPALRAS